MLCPSALKESCPINVHDMEVIENGPMYLGCISDLMAGQNFVPPDMIFLQRIQRFLTVNKIMSRKSDIRQFG